REVREVVELGADEIDIVLNRSLFLGGQYALAFEELVAAREAAGETHLKVILETGELGSYDRIRQASVLAMAAGADFIKTSTGKIQPAATLHAALCMMEAAREFFHETGRGVGVQVGGESRSGSTPPPPSRPTSSGSRTGTACSSAGTSSSRNRGSTSRPSTRPPRRRWPRWPRPARRTSTSP